MRGSSLSTRPARGRQGNWTLWPGAWPRGRARVLRALHASLDHYRIWHKITFARGRILATEGEAWRSLDDPDYFRDPGLFYRVDGDTIVVVACMHAKRNPRRWQRRS